MNVAAEGANLEASPVTDHPAARGGRPDGPSLVAAGCRGRHVDVGRRDPSALYLDRATLEEASDHYGLSRRVFPDGEARTG